MALDNKDRSAETAPVGLAFARLERGIGTIVAIAAAALLVVETAVLFIGVISRYVFRNPFTWTDELASILFLWLAMLGAVLAYQRGEHMRMGALVARAPLPARGIFSGLALAVELAFLGLGFWPTLDYAWGEAAILTPALEIPNIWRAAALPIGFATMLVLGLLQVGRSSDWRGFGLAVFGVIAIGLLLVGAKPLLLAMGNYRLLVFFVGIVGACVLSGVPIAFGFGIGTLAFLALTTRTPLTVIASRIDEGMSHIILLSVPLFVCLGLLIEITGMAKAMIDFVASLIGHLRGGLRYVLLATMYLVSGISGSKAADMAAVAPVLFPEMKQRGAKPGDLVALLSASGAMSETIPPSLVLITIGTVANVSISQLFTGGLLPAVVLALALCVIVWWRARAEDISGIEPARMPTIITAALIAVPGIALPFLIRTAVTEGVATATEVSTIGIAYTLAFGLVYWLLRKLSPAARQRLAPVRWERLWSVLVDTAALSGAILLIIGAATTMGWALTQSGFSRELAAAMGHLPGGSSGFLAVSIVVFIVLGSVLEGIPAIVLFGPLLFPIAKQFGINEVHYAMVVILAMGIGLFAPPFGVGYYAACAIGRADPAEGIKAIWPYLAALLVGLIIVAAVPWISIGFL
jgi:tripartite ATP-independent transporter DctM subunit